LVEAVASHEPGDEVTVEVLRRGERHRFRVQLGS
jgi:S1-C subfamily serine protease